MPLDLLFAFLLFAWVNSITPGPNNIMLLSSGLNFGFRRTIPHLLGICIGFSFMVLAVGLGLGELFKRYTWLYNVLRYLAAAYLFYLAWRIARSGPVEIGDENKKPISFLQAVAFQWVNPKAWMMAIVAITTYASQESYLVHVVIISVLFIFSVAPCGMIWIAFGNWLRSCLNKVYLRIFNISMAVLLILSLYPLLKIS
jgi:threonine/homoserine/homoserine lactone efflux protein